MRSNLRLVLVLVAAIATSGAAACSSCRRAPAVSDATYREAVTAFYTALAALETSQEVLARQKLDRVIALVPQEPAAWANLGLLLLRQQELEPARDRLTKAAELAPESGAIQQLLALTESRRGQLAAAIAHWRRAVDLDPRNARAAYALALEIERQGGAAHDAEAQVVLDRLLARGENLPARLDYARLAAKRGDASGLQQALGLLLAAAPSWPAPAQAQLKALQDAAATNPRAAATRVVFLKNVLVREPAYRRALAAISTPLDAVGEPLRTFLVLDHPAPQPAAADHQLAFSVAPMAGDSLAGASWVGELVVGRERPPVVARASAVDLWVGSTLVTRRPTPVPAPGLGPSSLIAADLSYDFLPDLVEATPAGLAIRRQLPGGLFEDATAMSGLPAAVLARPAFGGWPADTDTDGDLDVVVAPIAGPPFVLRNNGDGTLAVDQPFAICCSAVRGFVWADVDGDGVPDAAFLDERGAVHVFVNLRGGFGRQTVPAGPAPVAAIAAVDIGVAAGFSLATVSSDGAVRRLTLVEGAWQSYALAQVDHVPADLAAGQATLLVADLDNNGAADFVVAGRTSSGLALGGPGQGVTSIAPVAASLRAAADLDDDGRLELLGIDANQRVVVATSRGGTRYRWQTLRTRAASATGDQRINPFGIGGEVEVRSATHVQRRVITSPITHVGLGNMGSSDVIRIVWPNGVLQSEFEKPANATVTADQRLKGSCPWLFAWNGREMGFVTDVIWRSPLGLRINAQATADVVMTEDWVKVRGDQLVARDGTYDLRVTAELWETHFFDLVSLLVVDRPAGTEMFVDERFAVPAPALRPVIVDPVQAWASARDDRGRDVADLVRARDDRHVDVALGPYQGVTPPHFVELELPDTAPRRGPLWLVAQGWVHPTDSSINVALGQGRHARPDGLSLHVADRRGRFAPVRTGLGFPSGKDKTVLIELSGVLPAEGPRRLRLATNLEIYWDRLGWAVGRPEVAVTPARVPLQSADLRYRGYSVTRQREASTPERPIYSLAGTAPRWLDLEGYYTRFGDVRALLQGVDDRYVIMNAGDELALRFAEVPPPPPGVVRDFIVVGDGWVKDGDFNTSFSRTVLPLPTHASAAYATPPRQLEDDPVYRSHAEDFATYHTRYVSPARARGALARSVEEPQR